MAASVAAAVALAAAAAATAAAAVAGRAARATGPGPGDTTSGPGGGVWQGLSSSHSFTLQLSVSALHRIGDALRWCSTDCLRGVMGGRGMFKVCSRIRHGSGLAVKWTSVSPWGVVVAVPPSRRRGVSPFLDLVEARAHTRPRVSSTRAVSGNEATASVHISAGPETLFPRNLPTKSAKSALVRPVEKCWRVSHQKYLC